MPKVNTKALRSLARKVKPSILTGAITESADYIDELEDTVYALQETLRQEQEYSRSLLMKIKNYERALRRIGFCEFSGWSGSDVLGKVTDFANETLKENDAYHKQDFEWK
jgi:Mg2+ and Co2+ transporter CorA